MARRPKRPNDQLRAAMDEAGCSHSRLARSVVEFAAQAKGIRGLKYDHTSVLRWLEGEQPRHPGPELIAEVLSVRLARVVTPAELGMPAVPHRVSLGLDLPVTWPEGIAAVTALWRADVERRQFLSDAGFATAAYASAGMRWLTLPPVGAPAVLGKRRIGAADVQALREINRTYRQLDNRLGGGQLRATIVQLLDGQVTPLLRQASFTESTGRDLASAAAELSQLVGWMAYDSEAHGLAQRYLIQALGLARYSGDHALSAEILAAMSQQAVYVARPDQAIDLARVARTTADRAGLPILVTECHVAEAHGHAARNDARSCSLALTAAEQSFAQARTTGQPAWLSYFDEAYLSARIAHCFRDLGQGHQATAYARRSLNMNGSYVRGRAFNLALLGTALAQQGDAEQASAIGLKAADAAAGLQSRRSVRYVLDLRRRLTDVASSAAVRPFMERTEALARAHTARQ